MATMLPPGPESATSHEADASLVAEARDIRREIAEALSGRPVLRSSSAIRDAFANGARVIADLRSKERLSESEASKLLESLAVLFVHAYLMQLTERAFGRNDSALYRWLEEATR